ncbi:hypothetical protein [Oceanobacillus sp. 1P07AA]|uniref:hypothetical protein n=1 Tax=Oceanobacillus sp. 1P07AA TaxID=3132293 RepID=UPI0039A452AD
MIIASVLDEKEYIVPIVEGKTLRIFNSKTKQIEDFENPAVHLKEGRRGATLKFAEQKGAESFITPPQTFCELSYKKARTDGIQFFKLDNSIPFEQFEKQFHSNSIEQQSKLPENEIAPSF